MPIFKEIWSFSSSNSGTWSEVWYEEAGSIAIASSFSTGLLNARLRLASQLTVLDKIRVSQVDSPRVSVVKPVNLNGLVDAALNNPLDDSWAVIVTLSSSAVAATRKWWCRGCGNQFGRDAVSGRTVYSPEFAANMKSWISYTKAANFVVLKITPIGQGGVVKVRATSANGTANNGTTTITTQAAHGLLVDNLVAITQANKKELAGLNGRFRVLAVTDATHFTVQYRTPDNVDIPMATGYARKIAFMTGAVIDPAISGVSFVGSRKTKNVSTGSRGARSAQRIRNLA